MSEAGPPRIPGYEYLRDLGRGGFSDVYLYRQLMPERQVAVKVLRIDTLDQRQREAFTQEANTMALLAEHENIVSVLSADLTSDGRPYLVMVFYPGDDLGKRVSERPMGLAETLRTGIQLACAVESAHRMDVLHRDIKPANILTTRTGAPRLSDFGIAGNSKTLHDEEEIGVSIPWSAPEVLSGESNGSQATDVYSLGATIWNLLVGRSPFKILGGDNSRSAMIGRILRTPPPATGLGDVPASLDRLLQQCLAKDPAHRPRSALQLARELQNIEVQQNLSRTELVVLDPEIEAVATRPLTGPPGTAEPTLAKGPIRISAMPESPPAPQTLGRGPRSVDPATGAPTLQKRAAQVDGHGGDTHALPRPRTSPGPWLLLAAVALVAVGLAAWLLSNGDDEPSGGPETTDSQTQQSPAALSAPPPNAPDVADAVRRGDEWVFTWRPVDGAESYRYQEEGLAGLEDVAPGRTEIRVPTGGPKRCFQVFAYSNVGVESAASGRRCTEPGAGR